MPNWTRYVGLLVGVLSISCSTDETPVFMNFEYQLRCIEASCGGQTDYEVRQIDGLNGRQGLDLECDYKKDLSRLSIYAKSQEGNWISMNNSEVGKGQPSNCKVEVHEGNNTYQGDCTFNSKNDSDDPCELKIQVQGSGTLTGTVTCRQIPQDNNRANDYYSLLAPFSDTPVNISIENCEEY